MKKILSLVLSVIMTISLFNGVTVSVSASNYKFDSLPFPEYRYGFSNYYDIINLWENGDLIATKRYADANYSINILDVEEAIGEINYDYHYTLDNGEDYMAFIIKMPEISSTYPQYLFFDSEGDLVLDTSTILDLVSIATVNESKKYGSLYTASENYDAFVELKQNMKTLDVLGMCTDALTWAAGTLLAGVYTGGLTASSSADDIIMFTADELINGITDADFIDMTQAMLNQVEKQEVYMFYDQIDKLEAYHTVLVATDRNTYDYTQAEATHYYNMAKQFLKQYYAVSAMANEVSKSADTTIEIIMNVLLNLGDSFLGGVVSNIQSKLDAHDIKALEDFYGSEDYAKTYKFVCETIKKANGVGNVLTSSIDMSGVSSVYDAGKEAYQNARFDFFDDLGILALKVSNAVFNYVNSDLDNSNSNVNTSNDVIAQLKEKFPDGRFWNGGDVDKTTSSPCLTHSNCDVYGGCNCNSFSNAIQCFGFALKLGYDAYGTNPRNWSRAYSLDNIKPGDIINYDGNNPGHTVFVIGVDGDTVTFAECNWGSRCVIKWGRSLNKSQFNNLFNVYVAPYALEGAQNIASKEHNCSDCTYYEVQCKVTTESGLNVRTGPGTSYSSIDVLEKGTKIETIKKCNGWYFFDSQTVFGWVSAEYVKIYEATGTCGENVTWTLYDDGLLEIEGTGPMYDYSMAAPWCNYIDKIKSVIILDGVTSIGNVAFSCCESLTDVTIGNDVTSIGRLAFECCYSLTNVTIGNSLTSIGDDAFDFCISLIEITLPDSVASIGYGAFWGCISLTGITIPSSVTSIEHDVFVLCSSLESIIVTNGNTKYHSKDNCVIETTTNTLIVGCKASIIPDYITSIGDNAFSYCESLTSVTIPDSVVSIGDNAFQRCSSLSSVTIPDSVTSIGDEAFGCCSSLTEITIPDGVTSIEGNVFYVCSSLSSVTIPDSVTSIGDNAFSYCESLTSVTIPDSVTMIGARAFNKCTILTDVYYGGTEEQWSAITIGTDNDYLTNATIHFAKNTYTVSGTVKTFGDTTKAVTIELLSGETVVDTKTVTGNSGTYAFEEVEEGTYTLRVSKTKHAIREYEVTVADADVTQDTAIWLYGDVNGDGIINATDVLQINRKVANLNSLFNQAENADYRFKVANITAVTGTDTLLNSADILQINRKIANLSSIFDKIA